MSIAVVILNWNGKALLEEFLPSVVEYSSDAQIYVVDNASTDDSVIFIKENYKDIKCIVNSHNYGFAGGYNKGLKFVNEDIYILLNNDVQVSKEWLRPIINCFQNNQHVAVIQPKLLDYKNPKYFEYAGAAGGFIDKYAYPYCRGRMFNSIEIDNGQYDENVEIFWASGACFAIRKSVFDEVGQFDEAYFAHQEEIDLCWRVFNHNYKIMYCFDSVVYHLGGGTLDALNPRKTFLNFRNSLYNILRNVKTPDYFWIIFIRLMLDGLAGLRFIASGQPRHFFAVLKAHFSFYVNFRRIYKRRYKVKTDQSYFYINSIVKEYFFKSKKSFKDL